MKIPDAEQVEVRRMEDFWVEVPAQLADGSGYVLPAVKLRPGTGDGQVRISNVPPAGAMVETADLHRGIDLIEKEAA